MIIKTAYELINVNQLVSFWFDVDHSNKEIQLRIILPIGVGHTRYFVGNYPEDAYGEDIAKELLEDLFTCRCEWYDAPRALEMILNEPKFKKECEK